MIGLEAEKLYAESAKERQRIHGGTAPGKEKNTSGTGAGSVNGDARDQAAIAVGVGSRSISSAKRVAEDGKTGRARSRPAPSAQFLGHPVAAVLAKFVPVLVPDLKGDARDAANIRVLVPRSVDFPRRLGDTGGRQRYAPLAGLVTRKESLVFATPMTGRAECAVAIALIRDAGEQKRRRGLAPD
jgi:hypothetical protein